jgi:hypothetical protein
MFERIRRRLAGALMGRADLPPPGPPADTLLPDLTGFLRESPDRFARCFLRQETLAVAASEAPLFRRLQEAGLVTGLGSRFAPCVRLFPLEGLLVATDLLTRTTPDQVFSLMFEQVYLGRNTGARAGDAVLELCLGSGVNSLVAAGRGARVTGVELNPRAAAFARFNRALNGREFEILEGSLFAPVGDRRFDLVLVNPPFEPVPPGATRFLHSDGGEDGLDVVRALLADLPAHLAPAGRFEIISWSPAGAQGTLLVDLLRGALPEHRLEVHLLDQEPLESHLEGFVGAAGFAAWQARLASAGWDRLAFLFVRASRGKPPGVELLLRDDEIAACRAIADAFE